jgi:hypothetical protein
VLSLLRLTLPDVLKTVSPLVGVVTVLQLVLVHAPAAVFLQFLAGAALAALKKGSLSLIVGVFTALGLLRVMWGFSLASAGIVPLAYDAGSITTGVLTALKVVGVAHFMTTP